MSKSLIAILSFAVIASSSHQATAADPKPPGALRLLPGYQHERKQGFDSVPGLISKQGGLQIHYDIGAIPRPGAPRFGGQFTDQAKNTPANLRKWYKEQVIGGQPVHLAYTRQNMLRVSFPKGGINFSVEVKSPEQLAEALLIILSYPAPAEAK